MAGLDNPSDVPQITITGLAPDGDFYGKHEPLTVSMPIPEDWLQKDLRGIRKALREMVSPR